MKPLTETQIQGVINWMNTWEQLKNTAIPIRFKEDFSKTGLNKKIEFVSFDNKSYTKKEIALLDEAGHYQDPNIKHNISWKDISFDKSWIEKVTPVIEQIGICSFKIAQLKMIGVKENDETLKKVKAVKQHYENLLNELTELKP